VNEVKRFEFEGKPLEFRQVGAEWWATTAEAARALGYSRPSKLRDLFNKNAGAFLPHETCEVDLRNMGLSAGPNSESSPTRGKRGNLRGVRLFSPRGLEHLALIGATDVCVRFRRWVLTVIDALQNGGLREQFDALRLEVAGLRSERDALRLAQGNASVDLRLALEANAGMSKLASQILTTRRAEVRHEREVELFADRPNLFAGAPLTEIDERVIAALHLHGPFDSVGALAKHLRIGVARLGDSISTLAARRAIRRSEGKIALVPQPVAQGDPATN